MSPPWGELNVTGQSTFSATGYNPRTLAYTAETWNVSQNNNTVLLLQANASGAFAFELHGIESDDDELTGYTVEVYKYDTTTQTQTFITSVILQTGGLYTVLLDDNNYYNFVVKSPAGATVGTFNQIYLIGNAAAATRVDLIVQVPRIVISHYWLGTSCNSPVNVPANCSYQLTKNQGSIVNVTWSYWINYTGGQQTQNTAQTNNSLNHYLNIADTLLNNNINNNTTEQQHN